MPLPACDFGCECIEVWRPEPAEPGEPIVDIAQCLPVDGIQPPLAVRAYRGEPVVPQHFQVLRHRRLADVELGLDGRADSTRRQFAVGEQFEDAPADRVAQDVKCVHTRY